MIILGIETSCDETSAAVVKDGRSVLSFAISSSIQDQAAFGGVVPEIAARRQLEYIVPVVDKALSDASMALSAIDAIAVTKGPGLFTSLLVGTATARLLAAVFQKPLIGVHHTLGHLDSIWLESTEEITFPVLTLSISGGHTDLWFRNSHTQNERIGSTRDDAAGEAFDKGAMMLGLGYPGGPAIAKKVDSGERIMESDHMYRFSEPLKGEKTCDYS